MPHPVPAPPLSQPAESPPDVIAGGSEPSGAPSPRLVVGTAVLVLLLAGAVLLRPAGPSGGPAPTADPVRFALHPRSVVVPRHVPPADGRAAVAGLHLELVNTGEAAVVLSAVRLVPGSWQVQVVDRPQLRPGWSAVLDLRREVDCAPATDHGPVPTELVVEAEVEVGGRRVVRTVDVGPEQDAYEGRLDDVLGDPGHACDLEAAGPLAGPIGDLFGPG